MHNILSFSFSLVEPLNAAIIIVAGEMFVQFCYIRLFQENVFICPKVINFFATPVECIKLNVNVNMVANITSRG